MASLVTVSIVTYVDASGKRVKKGTKGARKVRTKARKYYGQGIPGYPPKKRFPLATQRDVALRMLADKVKKAERRGADLPDLQKLSTPLAEHLKGFEKYLRSREDRESTEAYIRLKIERIRRVLVGCRFVMPADIELKVLKKWIADMRKPQRRMGTPDESKEEYTCSELSWLLGIKRVSINPLIRRHGLVATGKGKARRYPLETVKTLYERLALGASPQTAKHYLSQFHSFVIWLCDEEEVLGRDPLRKLKLPSPETDMRRLRREITSDELSRFLQAAKESKRKYFGLSGIDRYMIYLCALSTGFRSQELALLTPERFKLKETEPFIELPARHGKNRKPIEQPLPLPIADTLRPYIAKRRPRHAVWPGQWFRRAAQILRYDLAAANVPYSIDGPDGPLYADFHSLRHTFISQLMRLVTIKPAQTLARHSDPRLTLRYSHAEKRELILGVRRLPDLLRSPSQAPETLPFPEQAKA